MALKEVWKKVRHPFTPASLITFAHAFGEKEQITANIYLKDVSEVHQVGAEMRKLFDAGELDLKVKLQAAQAAMEKELKAKEGKK